MHRVGAALLVTVLLACSSSDSNKGDAHLASTNGGSGGGSASPGGSAPGSGGTDAPGSGGYNDGCVEVCAGGGGAAPTWVNPGGPPFAPGGHGGAPLADRATGAAGNAIEYPCNCTTDADCTPEVAALTAYCVLGSCRQVYPNSCIFDQDCTNQYGACAAVTCDTPAFGCQCGTPCIGGDPRGGTCSGASLPCGAGGGGDDGACHGSAPPCADPCFAVEVASFGNDNADGFAACFGPDAVPTPGCIRRDDDGRFFLVPSASFVPPGFTFVAFGEDCPDE